VLYLISQTKLTRDLHDSILSYSFTRRHLCKFHSRWPTNIRFKKVSQASYWEVPWLLQLSHIYGISHISRFAAIVRKLRYFRYKKECGIIQDTTQDRLW